ncbi:MAG TPA: SGNH/GDSL hydrolase family protein [Trinickia sp.]|uniref:SGNH/GDSL hydrolase family protein n=1 Tax=Trinickia sp. TaxID=2571163 RepID=UPI002C277341|nr:SGNH/GDSL hydrolase family protein [Trinickia sp.]HTI18244.1 SGNH/GDSL hydrolase family protein [Trinickia sp.]
MGHRLRLLVALGALACDVFATPSCYAAAATTDAQQWVAAWATAVQSIPDLRDPPPLYRAPEVSGRTVREIVYPTASGQTVKLRVSNAYGRTPLVIDGMALARSTGGAAVRPGTSVQLTFGGRSSVVLEPGREVESDAVKLDVRGGAAYAVSIHVRPGQTMTAWHRVANQINYVSTPGDHTLDAAPTAYVKRFTASAWITSMSVLGTSHGAIAAIGDSITDGLRSSVNANRRWPDGLARRLSGEDARGIAVLDLGISGNRLLSDSACYGEALERRFGRDALDQAGVKAVIVLVGINDINFAAMSPRNGLDCDAPHTVVTASDIINGYRRLIDAAHRHGVRIFGATLTPAAARSTREGIRQAVNAWVRTGGAFDGVIDFDAALRDPAHMDRLRADYDSGDGIHPNDAGYAAMAGAIALGPLMSPLGRR